MAHLITLKVPAMQLRFKSGDAQAVVNQVRRAEAATYGSATRLFISGYWQVALGVCTQAPSSGVYGTYFGQEDADGTSLVAARPAELRLGISMYGLAEILRITPLDPSCPVLSVVLATPTKTVLTVPQNLGRLFACAATMRTREPAPALVAIGGIDLAAMPHVLESGVGPMAVMHVITQVADISAVMDVLQATFTAHVYV